MIESPKYGPYSPSRLDAAKCGYAFYRRYVDPNRNNETTREEGVAQARGSVVHLLLERVTQRLVENRFASFSPEEVRGWLAEVMKDRHQAAYEEVGEIVRMVELYIRNPPPMLTDDAKTEVLLAVRWDGQQFVECDYEDPRCYARGRADIFMISDDTTQAWIYDHKTQMNMENSDIPQFGFYAWLASKIYPFLDSVATVFHGARYGKYQEPYVWTKRDLARIEDDILTRIHIIEGRTGWQAVSNDHCNYCPFKWECPYLAERVQRDENGRLRVISKDFHTYGSTEKAIEVAEILNVCEEIVKACKEGLRAHVKASGPIAIAGKVYEYRAEEGIHWDTVNKKLKPRIYEIFQKHGVDPREFMGFSQTFSKSVWMLDKPELMQELSTALPRRTTTEFGGYKI